MKTKTSESQEVKVFFIHIIKRIFWGGAWGYLTLIATVEVLMQSLICYVENDWSLNNMWYVIGWGIWLFILTIIRIVCNGRT